MMRFVRFSEKIFAAVSLFLLSQALYAFFLGTPSPEPGVESPLLRSIFSAVYLTTFLLLTFHWKRTFAVLVQNKWIFFLLALAILSTLWSSVPEVTFRRAIALIGSTSFAIYMGSNYKIHEQLEILAWVFGVSIILNFLFVFLLPTYGIMSNGDWRGIYLHKNTLGECMLISFLIFYFLSKSARRHKFFLKTACILSLILIIFSKSATSLIGAIFLYAASKVLGILSLRSRSSVLLIIIFLLLTFFSVLYFTINLNIFLEANNRDITLTGRTPLWSSLWDFIKLNFWLGYGYKAFFSASHLETQILWKLHPWSPPHAHNGYIQIMLDFGLTGFLVFASGYFYSMSKALFNFLMFKDGRVLCIFILILYTVIFNFTEVSFFSVNNLQWTITLAFIYSLNSTIESKH